MPAELPVIFANLPGGYNDMSLFDQNFAYLLDLILNIPSVVEIVTVGGTIVVQPSVTTLILNKSVPSVTPVTLPSVASRNGLALQIVDWGGNAGDVTITPAIGETIMGLATAVLGSGGQGVGVAAAMTLWPSVDLSGWYVAP